MHLVLQLNKAALFILATLLKFCILYSITFLNIFLSSKILMFDGFNFITIIGLIKTFFFLLVVFRNFFFFFLNILCRFFFLCLFIKNWTSFFFFFFFLSCSLHFSCVLSWNVDFCILGFVFCFVFLFLYWKHFYFIIIIIILFLNI